MGRRHGKCGPRMSADCRNKELCQSWQDDITQPELKRGDADNSTIVEPKVQAPSETVATCVEDHVILPKTACVSRPPGSFLEPRSQHWHPKLPPLEGWSHHWRPQLLPLDKSDLGSCNPVADETLCGPDGETYDIFYPPGCVDEDLPEDAWSTATGETISEMGANSSDTESCNVKHMACREMEESRVCRQTSAEIGMEAMIAFMSLSAVARYPARAKLFEMVQAMATETLGKHLQRFSLVGSTALHIDTPDSDLDAVVFTKSCLDEAGVEMPQPLPIQVLRDIAVGLHSYDSSLKLQLVECTRVPVLTVLSADSALSLDLTVNQPLGEYHVLWFQSQRADPAHPPMPLHSVPRPSADGWSQGLEAAVLRCVKWWLRRRSIPVPKEGGYPSIVWTLMVLHVLRCSVFVDDVEGQVNRGRQLLVAVAAFFDRFAEGGLAGTFLFTGCAGAEFHPQASPSLDGARPQASQVGLSVLDPTTTTEGSAASGIKPMELAPRTSAATHLLYAYELRRAQRLSIAALAAAHPVGRIITSTSDDGSGGALLALFGDLGQPLNTLAATMPSVHQMVIVLHDNMLALGVLHRIVPKPGWQAPFLHRQDTFSSFALRRVDINETGTVTLLSSPKAVEWFRPEDFVCMAPLSCSTENALQLAGRRLAAMAGDAGTAPSASVGQPTQCWCHWPTSASVPARCQLVSGSVAHSPLW